MLQRTKFNQQQQQNSDSLPGGFLEAAMRMFIFDESSNKPPALTPYLDTELNWTIGHGYLLGRKMTDIRITPRIAMVMLEESVLEALQDATSVWGKEFYLSLEKPRQLGLLNLAFVLGETKLKKQFTNTVPAIAAKNWDEARALLWKSKWAKDVKHERAARVIGAICDCHLDQHYVA